MNFLAELNFVIDYIMVILKTKHGYFLHFVFSLNHLLIQTKNKYWQYYQRTVHQKNKNYSRPSGTRLDFAFNPFADIEMQFLGA